MLAIELYKNLADDTRLRCLLLILSQHELCVCELISALEVSQPKVSRHLALLKSAGLIVGRKQKQWVFYRLSPSLPSWVKQTLSLTLDNNSEVIQPNLQLLNDMGDRPKRQSTCC